MSRGGYRENSGRPLGSLDASTKRVIKAVHDIVAEHPEKYERAIMMLLEDALNPETKVRDRLAIMTVLIERLEGKAAQFITLQPQEKATIKELLRSMDTDERGE